MKEDILIALENVNKAITLIEINNLLELTSVEDYQLLKKNIDELVSSGKIHKTKKDKYILMKYCASLKNGIIRINKSGNGFVDIDDGEDIFVSKTNLNGAINGDFVEVDVYNDEGIIIRILKRDLSTLVGEIINKHNKLCFKLDDSKKDIVIELTKESLAHCVEGHKVLVKIIKELKTNLYLGEIVKILGHKNDPGVDILSIAAEHNISLDIPTIVQKQVDNLPTFVEQKDLTNRKDLRQEVIFTIDGDDTKDIDDAISIEKQNGIYTLGVHIADVSYYVKEGSPLFNYALERGTSSYLADTVIPMLPHELSNGICSLNENADRLTISCQMQFDINGNLKDYDIFLSVINSKKKMTYKKVNQILIDNVIPEGYELFADKLKIMLELAHILRKKKEQKGYIDFGLDEAKVLQDENGKAIDIVKRVQLEGEKLIEDFMIAANETVATHINNLDLPFVYRVHGQPRSEKIEDFANLLKIMKINVPIDANNISPKSMQSILYSLKNESSFALLSDMLLRSMKKAEYSSENIGHFGLASDIYTHFTSPIRRFPDLMVHTLLHKYLFNHQIDKATVDYYANNLPNICKIASEREVAAVEAEREVLDMKMAEYMQDHIGEEYAGVISGVTSFGLFVKLPNLVEGLVHISTLHGFYNYIPELLSLVSQNDIKYTLGDKVKIKVTSANKETRMIDFELCEVSYGDK